MDINTYENKERKNIMNEITGRVYPRFYVNGDPYLVNCDFTAKEGELKGFYYGAPIIQQPIPKKIIYNETTTVVIWEDNTKTVVRCSDGDNFHEDIGFLAAVAKKIYGHRSTYMKHLKGAYRQDNTKKGK